MLTFVSPPQMTKDFLNIIDSYNLTPLVHGSTHEHGHTLDLVILCGLLVSNTELLESRFSS